MLAADSKNPLIAERVKQMNIALTATAVDWRECTQGMLEGRTRLAFTLARGAALDKMAEVQALHSAACNAARDVAEQAIAQQRKVLDATLAEIRGDVTLREIKALQRMFKAQCDDVMATYYAAEKAADELYRVYEMAKAMGISPL